MKRAIIVLISLWILGAIASILLINNYINSKDGRLRTEIRDSIENLFRGQSADDGDPFLSFEDGFFDSPMNGYIVKNFKRAQIPDKPNRERLERLGLGEDSYKQSLERWNSDYGDVSSLWDLNWGSKNPEEFNDYGWFIAGIQCSSGEDEAFIQTFSFFPYRVALKKTEWGNYYTVPQAVDEAFAFYTTNEKSIISSRYKKGSIRRIWNKIYGFSNEYYGVRQSSDSDCDLGYSAGVPIPGGAMPEKGGPIKYGWMHNGYYRVYIAVTQSKYYGIYKHRWNPDTRERNKLLLWWLMGVSIFFLIPILVLTHRVCRKNKLASEPLKEKLRRLCSPSAFMSPYNKELIDKANLLYPRILQSEKEEDLIPLADEAQQELGVSLISKEELREVLNRVSPNNFMNPYNAEKISLANELYGTLKKENLLYSEFISVKDRIHELE